MTQEPAKNLQRVMVDLTVTVEDARKVVWYRKGTSLSLGELLDTKQIEYSDLAYAVEHGNKPQVRVAARTLLAHWLGKPETVAATQRYGPEVIEGSHYLEEKERENVMGFGYFLGAGFFGLILVVVLTVVSFIQTKNLANLAFGSVVALVLLIYATYLIKRQLDGFIETSKGREGEDAIVEKLRGALDNQWTIFRNLHLPNRKDDLDVVLVGPGGVWVTEVKAYSGTIRFQSGNWERQTKRGWTKLDFNPSRQVTRNAKRLNDYLKREGIVRFVERAIAIAKPQPISNFDSADIPIWLLPTIEEQVAKLSTKTSPTQKEIEQLKALFKGLAEKQISKEETK